MHTKYSNHIKTIKETASYAATTLNGKILKKYLKTKDNTDTKKTHLFEGRYENIYLTEKQIPELAIIINEALTRAKFILQNENLRAGYWFNDMPPGSKTLIHSHDDYDEQLSAVYYVYVPKNSGDLIIHETPNKAIKVSPSAGEFIFFNPAVQHEVTENKSRENRLSIGINFGPKITTSESNEQ